MIDPKDLSRNRASRERLARVIARLGGRDVALADGWTAAAVLAHLAFWDRVAALRIEKYLRDGKAMAFFEGALPEYVNEAALPQWTRTPLDAAAAQATAAAEAFDLIFERLGSDDAANLRALGRPNLGIRFTHREEHLDQIERALG